LWSDESLAAEPARTGDEEESWASATPVAGSSVAMPSGHGPRKGNVTPGWVTDACATTAKERRADE
jgi:hypothetical protein